jgi:hypothetical protein
MLALKIDLEQIAISAIRRPSSFFPHYGTDLFKTKARKKFGGGGNARVRGSSLGCAVCLQILVTWQELQLAKPSSNE